jgi:hypothetical protein
MSRWFPIAAAAALLLSSLMGCTGTSTPVAGTGPHQTATGPTGKATEAGKETPKTTDHHDPG